MATRFLTLSRRTFWSSIGFALPIANSSRGYAAEDYSVIDVSNTPLGSLPAGFVTARTGKGSVGTWSVAADTSVASGRVITQTSTDQTNYRFPLAIYETLSTADVDVSVRFKSVGGTVDRAGGLAIRLIDPDNYYVVRANALEDNVNFYRVVRGSRREIEGVSVKVASDVWHTLGLKAEGENFVISFEGNVLFTATDRALPNFGKIALWTKADSVTQFDAFSIRTLR